MAPGGQVVSEAVCVFSFMKLQPGKGLALLSRAPWPALAPEAWKCFFCTPTPSWASWRPDLFVYFLHTWGKGRALWTLGLTFLNVSLLCWFKFRPFLSTERQGLYIRRMMVDDYGGKNKANDVF